MASLLNVTIEAIRKSRYRIRKKLEFKFVSDVDQALKFLLMD